jgi:hypothetical protein
MLVKEERENMMRFKYSNVGEKVMRTVVPVSGEGLPQNWMLLLTGERLHL